MRDGLTQKLVDHSSQPMVYHSHKGWKLVILPYVFHMFPL